MAMTPEEQRLADKAKSGQPFTPGKKAQQTEPAVQAESFGQNASQLSTQIAQSAEAEADQLYAAAYIRQMQNQAIMAQAQMDCISDALSPYPPADPARRQAWEAMQAPKRAMMQVLTTNVMDENGVNVQVGKPRSLGAGLQSLTQQHKLLGSGK